MQLFTYGFTLIFAATCGYMILLGYPNTMEELGLWLRRLGRTLITHARSTREMQARHERTLNESIVREMEAPLEEALEHEPTMKAIQAAKRSPSA